MTTDYPTGDTPPEPLYEPSYLSAIARCAEYRNQVQEIRGVDEEITEATDGLKALRETRKVLVDNLLDEISGYTQPEEPLLKLIPAGSATNEESPDDVEEGDDPSDYIDPLEGDAGDGNDNDD